AGSQLHRHGAMRAQLRAFLFHSEGEDMEQNDFSAERPATGSTGNGSVGTNDADFGRASGTTPETSGLKDRARDIAGTAGDRLADVGSTVRERAGTAKDSLADALESGAEKIRSRTTGQTGQLAG